MKQCIGQRLPAKPEDYPGFWLSVSKVKVFKTCPAQYRFNYIEKLPKKERDYHVYGKFTHEILEVFEQKRIDGCKVSNGQLMNECFINAIESFKETLTDEQKAEAFGCMSEYLMLLKSGSGKKQLLGSKVIGVEENFWIDIDGKVLLRGFIDRTQLDPDGVIHIADYKTSKKTDYLKKDYFQLLVYAYVKCLNNPEIKKVRCSYIMLRLGFEYITKEFTRDEVMKVEQMLLDYADTMQEEKLFLPETSPLCFFCDFVDSCPEGQVAADEYEERKRRREELAKPKDRWGKDSW